MITINITKMFSHREPWDCSNSVVNLGPLAAELTWQCAMEVAAQALRDSEDNWRGFESVTTCVDGIKSWSKDAGAWDREEIEAWTDQECLALLVQNVASDLRQLGSDDLDFAGVVDRSINEMDGPDHPVTAPYIDETTGDVMAYWST
jgi:hypothetical protein